MLKKFLKFLRGDSEEPEEFDGSYLGDLLRRVEPRMVEDLDACPKHDPLPLLVAEILRESAGEQFNDEIDCPVTDGESASLEPPPPPPDTVDEEEPPTAGPPPAPDAPAEDESADDVEDSGDEDSTVEDASTDDSEEVVESEPDEESAEEESGEADPEDDEASSDGSDETGEADDEAESDSESEEEESAEEEATDDASVDDASVEESDDEESDDEESDDEESDDEESDDEESDDDAYVDEEADDEEAEDEESEDEESEDEASETADDESDADEAESADEDEASVDAEEDEEASEASDENDAEEPPVGSDETRPVDLESVGVAESGEPPTEDTPLDDELDTSSYEVEAAVDADRNIAEESDFITDDEVTKPGKPRVDSELVLEMGRIFLGMLVENDRLPVELQMSPGEVEAARRLLEGYFLAEHDVENRAQEMLRLVEDKFDEGLFSQARILLQLFDADKATRIENDRNLFYEEMILRFGIQRRHPVGDDIQDLFERRIEQMNGADEDIEELFDWLAQTVYITFDMYGRDPEELEVWESIAAKSERPEAEERLLDVIPSRRWRLLSDFSTGSLDLLEEQMTPEYVGRYFKEHVKTCYFILRAVGDTGMEPYLDVFFDWVDEEFDVNGPQLMPWIYNETTANDRVIDAIFDELYEDRFREKVEEKRQSWEVADLEEGLESFVSRIGRAELSEIPPGHYDFGRFILDELFGLDYHSDAFPFKLHRLT